MFDGDRNVGRIHRVGVRPDGELFWGVSLQLIGRKTYGRAPSLDEEIAFLTNERIGPPCGR